MCKELSVPQLHLPRDRSPYGPNFVGMKVLDFLLFSIIMLNRSNIVSQSRPLDYSKSFISVPETSATGRSTSGLVWSSSFSGHPRPRPTSYKDFLTFPHKSNLYVYVLCRSQD